MIRQTIQRLVHGKINPLEATLEIDTQSGGIQSVNFRKGITLQVQDRRESISTRGLSKKQIEKLAELAALSYLQAQQNGHIRPGEVHIGKGLSSKHYAHAFREYIGGLVEKYSAVAAA